MKRFVEPQPILHHRKLLALQVLHKMFWPRDMLDISVAQDFRTVVIPKITTVSNI